VVFQVFEGAHIANPNTSREKNIFSDSQIRDQSIILWDICNDVS
jgi:hypothetical protein